MTEHCVIRRTEMLEASLQLGGKTIDLAPYASTGLVGVAVAARGQGKTNAVIGIAEQLSRQGWVSILFDAEGELGALFPHTVPGPEMLHERLRLRDTPMLVVQARDAGEFVPFGKVILEAADTWRKPLFVVVDEGQLFSTARLCKGELAEATQLLDEFAGRGRKRALDLFVTALRYSNSLSRSLFSSANLTLLGALHDPAAWPALASLCARGGVRFPDLQALCSGDFYCFSKTGVERVRLALAQALRGKALKVGPVQPSLPRSFVEWDRALASMSDARLRALTPPLVSLLASVAGLTAEQVAAGMEALQDELGSRPA